MNIQYIQGHSEAQAKSVFHLPFCVSSFEMKIIENEALQIHSYNIQKRRPKNRAGPTTLTLSCKRAKSMAWNAYDACCGKTQWKRRNGNDDSRKRARQQPKRTKHIISFHYRPPKMRMPKGNSEYSLYIAKILTTNWLVSDNERVGEKGKKDRWREQVMSWRMGKVVEIRKLRISVDLKQIYEQNVKNKASVWCGGWRWKRRRTRE